MDKNLSEKEIEDIFHQTDLDGDGQIDFEEFLAATTNIRNYNLEYQNGLVMETFDELKD